RHVVVISVDGMGASFYAAPRPGLRIPNIRRLMEGGSYAEGVEGVYPTVTYPAHTTLVTGRRPAEHGVYTNLSSRAAGQHPRARLGYRRRPHPPGGLPSEESQAQSSAGALRDA